MVTSLAEAGAMGKTRFVGLDGLRGICALSVLLEHCERLFAPGVIFCHGWLAVDMFFMLSGFVIAAGYDARLAGGLTTIQFTWLRIKRLAPVYWAGLVLCGGAALAHQYFGGPGGVFSSSVMAAFLIPQVGTRAFAYPANPVAWTLAWELVANILYAAWLYRLGTRRLLALVALLLTGAAVVSVVGANGWSFGMSGFDIALGGLRTVPEFLIGALLYRSYRAGAFARLPVLTPFLPLTMWLVLAILPQGLPPLVDFLLAVLPSPLLLALLVRGGDDAPAWFRSLGGISYPLYASHLAPIWLAWYTPFLGLNTGPNPLRAWGVVLLAVALAWVIHRWIDPAGRPRKPAGFRQPAACDPAPDSV
jgi:peptidoglycan/LPS O-acetylase OafA/YrhL